MPTQLGLVHMLHPSAIHSQSQALLLQNLWQTLWSGVDAKMTESERSPSFSSEHLHYNTTQYTSHTYAIFNGHRSCIQEPTWSLSMDKEMMMSSGCSPWLASDTAQYDSELRFYIPLDTKYIGWSDVTHPWPQCDRHFVGQHVILCVVKWWRFVALFE